MPPSHRLETSIHEIVREFDREMAQVGSRINEMVQDALEEGIASERGPLYGLSLEIGTDGLPHIHRFGSAAGARIRTTEGDVRPFLSWNLDNERNEVVITTELPGFDKEDISIELANDTVKVHAENEDRSFHAECSLPLRLKADEPHATLEDNELRIVIDLEPRQETRTRAIPLE